MTSPSGAASIAIGGNNGIARSANVIPVKIGCGSSVSSSSLSRGLNLGGGANSKKVNTHPKICKIDVDFFRLF